MPRKSISPVELIRLIQALQVIAKARHQGDTLLSLRQISDLIDAEIAKIRFGVWLGKRRVNEILKEVEACGFCKREGQNVSVGSAFDDTWDSWNEAISEDLYQSPREEWFRIHSFLYLHHSIYRSYYDQAKEMALIDPLVLAEQLGLRPPPEKLHPTISTLTEWGLKLGRIQRNVLTGRSYVLQEPTNMKKVSTKAFLKCLCEKYLKIRQEKSDRCALSLPKVQEMVCQDLRISRSKFTSLLENIYRENHKNIFLEAGIITSYAYEEHVVSGRKMLSLGIFPATPWYLSTFYYEKRDWEDIEINSEVKRFIRIEPEFLEEVLKCRRL